jgi:[NiFe] hydrogenase diaphorase moiety large subunit
MDKQQVIISICAKYDNNPQRMMDILWGVQNTLGWISTESMERVASATQTYRVEVEGVASFYSFFKTAPQGKLSIHVCEDIIDQHAGMADVLKEFEQRLGIPHGNSTLDGLFSLHTTPCIGMSDQAPAALINDQVVTQLTPQKVSRLVNALKRVLKENPESSAQELSHLIQTASLKSLNRKTGDGNNSHPLIQTMVNNHIRKAGPILLADTQGSQALSKALMNSPEEIIQALLAADLKGRGGAGFQIARKWQFAASTPADKRYIICNADEGEPGTFKDRVLLTERAHTLIEGMTIAAFAVGSEFGILYLRAEYRYLLAYLEQVLEERRNKALLGPDILIDEADNTRFSFDIRIQIGAGAYICGEESSLISSCEGKRGEPKNKPPFPAQSGYLGYPTVVNNVETFCNVPSIIEKGAEWFRGFGTEHSKGTKLLSICGDCESPGIYEVEHGVTVAEVLAMSGASDTEAVQVGGASGEMIARIDFNRRLCFEDLPTAGAIMVFSAKRNILDIVDYFMHFFIEESCGYCTPCRVGNVFLKKGLEKIMLGQGEVKDLDSLKSLGQTIIQTSRCGLGHTSPKPILSTISNFPLVYSALLKEHKDGQQAGFNIQQALNESRIIAKRRSIIFDPHFDRDDGGK